MKKHINKIIAMISLILLFYMIFMVFILFNNKLLTEVNASSNASSISDVPEHCLKIYPEPLTMLLLSNAYSFSFFVFMSPLQ